MFYEILKNLCKENNITITTLLKSLKLSTSKGTAWKNGSIPSGDILAKIADYFNVSIDYLLRYTDKKEKSSESAYTEISDDDIKFALFNGNREITDEMYEEVKQFAQFVINRKKNGNNRNL